MLGDSVSLIDPMGLMDANSGGGVGFGGMLGFGGANFHEHVNCSSNGCFLVTTICGRIGLGLHIGGGMEGNAGFDPDGTYTKDCDGDKKDCTYDWSLGIGGEIQAGFLGSGGSVSGGSLGGGAIMDSPIPFSGFGGGVGIGVEACVIISCPI